MLKVQNMRSNSSGREVANQFVITDTGRIVFQSYSSTIAEINYNTGTILIYPAYNYSKTTGKYRNQFFEQEGFSALANLKSLDSAISEGKFGEWKIQKVS